MNYFIKQIVILKQKHINVSKWNIFEIEMKWIIVRDEWLYIKNSKVTFENNSLIENSMYTYWALPSYVLAFGKIRILIFSHDCACAVDWLTHDKRYDILWHVSCSGSISVVSIPSLNYCGQHNFVSITISTSLNPMSWQALSSPANQLQRDRYQIRCQTKW